MYVNLLCVSHPPTRPLEHQSSPDRTGRNPPPSSMGFGHCESRGDRRDSGNPDSTVVTGGRKGRWKGGWWGPSPQTRTVALHVVGSELGTPRAPLLQPAPLEEPGVVWSRAVGTGGGRSGRPGRSRHPTRPAPPVTPVPFTVPVSLGIRLGVRVSSAGEEGGFGDKRLYSEMSLKR